MFGSKHCGCSRFGGKAKHSDFGNKSRGRGDGPRRNIHVDKALGAGHMGPNRQPLGGMSHNEMANGLRDLPDHGNAQDAMRKRAQGPSKIESRKKNKSN